jgi:hypothetical protein
MLCMPPFDFVDLASFGEFLQPVGASRLQHPIARIARSRIGDDQRALNQPRQEIDDCESVDGRIGGDGGGSVDVEAAGKNRQPPQHDALVLGQQIVAPVERGAQRLVTRQRGARSAREQPEAIA